MNRELSGSEALYAFMAWLTYRSEVSIFSSNHNAAPAADRVNEFCIANNLTDPIDGWEKLIVYPSEDKT